MRDRAQGPLGTSLSPPVAELCVCGGGFLRGPRDGHSGGLEQQLLTSRRGSPAVPQRRPWQALFVTCSAVRTTTGTKSALHPLEKEQDSSDYEGGLTLITSFLLAENLN